MSTVLLDTYDLGEAEEVFSATYGSVHMTVPERDTPTHTRISRSCLGSTNVYAEDLTYTFNYAMAPPEKILLARIRSGTTELSMKDGPAALFGPGRAAAFGAFEGEPFGGTFYRCRLDVFAMDRAVLGQVAAGRSHIERPVRLTGSVPLSEAANQQLVAAMDYVRDAATNNPSAMRNPLIAGAAQRYVAASMLATYPNTAVLEPTIEDRHDTTPTLLRRAIAFIDENAHTDITITDIAAAVYITPRALQYMFRKHRDCTPTEYVRRVRLHYAHLDLVAGNGTTTTVADVARRWRFGHLGRFALAYRKVYGESPNVTLRR
ncbi:helix-turn-helix transcriptional regulator [Mycobacterium sp.]|uniref:helix-turn-helix transcriptional regulator n=1 Tax=Mycobacterium sp. TaxID=1785 RepID=UPI003D6C4D8B